MRKYQRIVSEFTIELLAFIALLLLLGCTITTPSGQHVLIPSVNNESETTEVTDQPEINLENFDVKPPKLDRDLSILGMRIGDSIHKIKSTINARAKENNWEQPQYEYEKNIDLVTGKAYINRIKATMYHAGKKENSMFAPRDEFDVRFTDFTNGNRVTSIIRSYIRGDHYKDQEKVLAVRKSSVVYNLSG
jgi:hypothetical protein